MSIEGMTYEEYMKNYKVSHPEFLLHKESQEILKEILETLKKIETNTSILADERRNLVWKEIKKKIDEEL